MKGEKRERIIRILLDEPDGNLTAYRIHKKADCSEQWVGSFLRKLRSLDLINGTRVVDVIGLYKYWLEIRIPPKYAEYHLQTDPMKIIGRGSLPYALTTYQADNIVHKYLLPTRTDIYILEEDLDKWHKKMISKGLVGPGNTRILVADPHIIDSSFEKENYPIVPRPQLICDLLMEGGIAIDAANILVKKWYHDLV